MLKVGLTGGIGSGKTTVASIFELLDIPVFDADAQTKKLYQEDQQLIESLKGHFGEGIYTGNVLDRAALARIVFEDPEKLKLLNELVHPRAISNAEQWMKLQQTPYVIKEAALIFESGSAAGLDLVIGVWAPESIRLKRAMDRDGASREEILSRMKTQIAEDIKMKLCDFIIRNDEQEAVIPQVLALHQTLSERAHQHQKNRV